MNILTIASKIIIKLIGFAIGLPFDIMFTDSTKFKSVESEIPKTTILMDDGIIIDDD